MLCSGTATEDSRTPWAKPDYTLKGPWGFRMKERVICMCEGAQYCYRENPAKQRGGNAIPGLHSNWVTDIALAMARPWQDNVLKCDMVKAFVDAKIGMILNLQEVGEHDSCGPGNLSSTGFSYDPESFTSAGIGFYNFSWRDMGVPNLELMLDIVQVMDYVANTEGRKIAVHCHAGLGRTGLAIACFFVFTKLEDARSAIKTVRAYRPGALQTSAQVMFVSVFEQYISHLRCLFGGSCNFLPPPCRSLGSDDASSWALAGGTLPPRAPSGTTPSRSDSPAPKPAPEGRSLSAPTKPKSKSLSRSGSFSESLSGLVSGVLPKSRSNRISCSGSGTSTPTSTEPVDVKVQGGMRTETYQSGLTIVKPMKRASSEDSAGPPPTALLNDLDLGLDMGSATGNDFHVSPSSFSPDWLPNPPTSYEEALHRQQRLLHGQQRRVFLNLHMLLKEACFVIISAAESHERGPAQATSSAPAQQEGAPTQPLAISSFAAAVAACVESSSGGKLADSVIASLAQQPQLSRVFLKGLYSWSDMQEAVVQLKQLANQHEYGKLAGSPLMAIIALIADFFASFDGSKSCLSISCLHMVAEHYEALPFEVPETADAREAQMTWSKALFQGTKPADQELLLLFAALLRHMILASGGPGCEEALLVVAKWCCKLMLGYKTVSSGGSAEEALLCLMWFLVTNDIAYSALLIVKQQRDAWVVGGNQGVSWKPESKVEQPPSSQPIGSVPSPRPAETPAAQTARDQSMSSSSAPREDNPKEELSCSGEAAGQPVSKQEEGQAGKVGDEAHSAVVDNAQTPTRVVAGGGKAEMGRTDRDGDAHETVSPGRSPPDEAPQNADTVEGSGEGGNSSKGAGVRTAPTSSPAAPKASSPTPLKASATTSPGLSTSTDIGSPTPSQAPPSPTNSVGSAHQGPPSSRPPPKSLLSPKKAKVHLPPLPRQQTRSPLGSSGGGAAAGTSGEKLPATPSVHHVWE